VAIFVGKELKAQLKFKLDNRCSNNQAEQLALAKALEVIDAVDIAENSPRTIAIFTDSRITINPLKNVNNHSYLIEEIRKRISILGRTSWTIEFSWVKAHVGIYGNELADHLAKAAACNRDTTCLLQQDSKEYVIQRNRRRSYIEMAKRVGKLYEGSHNKTVLPKRMRQG
jgi:ribonuclease HI